MDAIAANANRLIGGFSTAVLRYIDGAAHLAAFTPTDPAGDRVLQSSFPVPFAQFPPYRLVASGVAAQLPDTEVEPAARDIARARGYRSMLFAPLMSDGQAIGTILNDDVNQPPVAVDDSATTDEDTSLTLTQANLKGNDTLTVE